MKAEKYKNSEGEGIALGEDNEVLVNMRSRRSVRQYSERKVEEDKLAAILNAGTFAPSGMNRQSAVMVVVEQQSLREKLRAMNAEIMGKPDSDPFYGAPTVIVVLADKTVMTHVEDGSLVMGNLMNAAYSLGVDSCWIHRAKEEFESEDGKRLLKEWGLSENYVGIGHCALGYRTEDCSPAVRERKPNYIIRK